MRKNIPPSKMGNASRKSNLPIEHKKSNAIDLPILSHKIQTRVWAVTIPETEMQTILQQLDPT